MTAPTAAGWGTTDRSAADEAADRAAIHQIIDAWVVRRDSAQWDELLPLFHADGVMSATWKQSSAAEFVAGSKANWERGIYAQHFLGGSAINFGADPDRAIAQTKMTISQRAPIHGVLVDVVCIGRFYDFFARRDGRWGIVLRQPIYERDRWDPVVSGEVVTADMAKLAAFPDGFRHLAYLQTEAGMTVKTDMPGRIGPELDALYMRGAAWLAGAKGHPLDDGFGA